MAVVGDKPLAASWSEAGKVHIWDISHPLKAVNDPMVLKGYIENKESPRPLFTFKGTQPGAKLHYDSSININFKRTRN